MWWAVIAREFLVFEGFGEEFRISIFAGGNLELIFFKVIEMVIIRFILFLLVEIGEYSIR